MLWKKLLILWQMFILVYYSNLESKIRYNSESKFDAIANKMKELGSKEYAWKKIAKQYNDLW